MKNVVNNAAGPTGAFGIFYGLVPNEPREWLIFLSTALVIFQLIHWIWRFLNWLKKA